MAEEELTTVTLHNNFYHDRFSRVLFILGIMIIAAGLLLAASLYLFLSKPAPVYFSTGQEWRVTPDVALDQPHLENADLLQWVSNALPSLFNLDFLNYTQQLNSSTHYFTDDGWKKFLAQLGTITTYDQIQKDRLFLGGSGGGAPFILNQGVLTGRYSWWVQMPVDISYSSFSGHSTTSVTIKALVVRSSTLTNIDGVLIDNIIVSKGGGDQIGANG